jgi:hypothetical protein
MIQAGTKKVIYSINVNIWLTRRGGCTKMKVVNKGNDENKRKTKTGVEAKAKANSKAGA